MKLSKLVLVTLAAFAASCGPSTAFALDTNTVTGSTLEGDVVVSHTEYHEQTDFGGVVGTVEQRRKLLRARPRPTLSSCGGANKGSGSSDSSKATDQAAVNVDAAGSAGSATLSAEEDEVVKLVNEERKKAGCGALTVNAKLTAAARAHSTDMATKNFFDHTSPSGSTMSSRIKAAGYTGFRQIAENIAAGQQTPASVMKSWMNSSGHRANILNCGLKEIGVGVAKNSNSRFKIYWTQDFGTSSSSSTPSNSPSTSKAPAPTPTSKLAPTSKQAPTSTPAPDTTSPPPAGGSNTDVTSEENAVVTLVNNERSKAGCGPLSINAKLTAAARAHSNDMATNNFFDHTSPTGSTMSSRIKAAGYTNFRQIAENIAAGQQTPQSVMTAWMNSSGHRANILNCGLKEIGVGVARKSGSSFGIYWTQDFGTQF